MRTTSVAFLTLFACLPTLSVAKYFDADYSHRYTPARTIYSGTIQFPLNLHHVPDIRLYYKGYRIRCETNHENKRASYTIADDNHISTFKLLFTEHLQFETEQNDNGQPNNVVKYLKVPEGAHYKFYSINQVTTNSFLEEADNSQPSSAKIKWKVRELRHALHNGIIPEDTIIVCINPDYIDKVEGGNATTLPTFKIRPDLISFVGSEEKLVQKTDELLLSLVMDCDAIHAAIQQEIRPKYEQKMIVTLTT